MEKTIWLVYDLGVTGDYSGLYTWLDDLDAKEIGNNAAVLTYTYQRNLIDEIKNDLVSKVSFGSNDRIYLIHKVEENGSSKVAGEFIIGNRKAAPWVGYGENVLNFADVDE